MQVVAIFFAVVVACAMAMPEPPVLRRGIVPVLSRTDTRDEFGQFAQSYLTGDGISLTGQGALKPRADGKDFVLVQQGSYSYTAPDGTPIMITYTADENGFRPVGKHIPVSVVA